MNLIAVAVVASLASTGPVLPMKTAQRRAAQEAVRVAMLVSTDNDRVVPKGARGCKRKSRRTVDCKMYFMSKGKSCTWKVRVQYSTRTGRRVVVRELGDPTC